MVYVEYRGGIDGKSKIIITWTFAIRDINYLHNVSEKIPYFTSIFLYAVCSSC